MIRIVTDSSCDLPDSVLDDMAVEVVPLTVRFGNEEFVDRHELTVDEFWRRVATVDELPTTAAPSVGRFAEAFGGLLEAGADHVVAVCLSSELSATHRAAELAAAEIGSEWVSVIDSRLVSTALGLVVIEAAAAARAGGTPESVVGAATQAVDRTNLFAALDTLDHLRKGGRIGTAAAFFGSLLSVKPLITLEDGAVAAAGRVRTRTKAKAAVLQRVEELGPTIQELAVVHASPDDIDEFAAAIADRVGRPPMVARLGPVVGTHAGPGVLGVVYRET